MGGESGKPDVEVVPCKYDKKNRERYILESDDNNHS